MLSTRQGGSGVRVTTTLSTRQGGSEVRVRVWTYIKRGLPTLLDGSQALVVDVSFQKLLQLPQPVCDPGHQVVHPAQI